MSISSSTTLRYLVTSSPLGHLLIATISGRVCALSFPSSEDDANQQIRQMFPKCSLVSGGDHEQRLLTGIVNFLTNETPVPPSVHLHLTGTPFQRHIWTLIQDIPPGTTCTYHDLAMKAGKPGAVRAVARACGANKIGVLIPCHRVIGKNGNLTGYRWGMERKKRLLELEKRLGRLAP